MLYFRSLSHKIRTVPCCNETGTCPAVHRTPYFHYALLGFNHHNTRINGRLLGPCYKTGGRRPSLPFRASLCQRSRSFTSNALVTELQPKANPERSTLRPKSAFQHARATLRVVYQSELLRHLHALPSPEGVKTSRTGIGTLQPTLTGRTLSALPPMGLLPLAHNDVADF